MVSMTVNGSAPGRVRERRFRVEWLPGSDQLLGTCFCSAQRVGSEPNEVWDWLLAHPDDHLAAGSGSAGAEAGIAGGLEPGDG